MGRLETANGTVVVLDAPDIDLSQHMDNETIQKFAVELKIFNAHTPLESLVMAEAPAGTFTIRAETKLGQVFEYVMQRDGNEFHYSVSTEDTLWDDNEGFLNIELRRAMQQLVVFGINAIEVSYP